MKKLLLTFAALFMMAVSANAMSYEQARQQALFLTDKMAYELNLTEEQYEAAYEINLDYLMSVNHHDELYGIYWEHRNLDLSYILLDWQYRAYLNASYFYRPLYWRDGFWHFGIYARYPHRDYFYFGMPRFYAVYRGGHSWHTNGGRSWYHGRDWHKPHPNGGPHTGMRDGFKRGDYGQGNRGMNPPSNRNNNGNGTQHFGGNRPNDHQGKGNDTRKPDNKPNGLVGGGNPAGKPANGNTHPRQTDGGNFGGNRNSTGAGSNGTVRFGRESSTRKTVNNPPASQTTTKRQDISTSTRQAPATRVETSRPAAATSSSRSNSSASRSNSSFGGSSSRSSAGSPSRSSGASRGSSSGNGSRGGNFGGRR